jgi:hypothetical protein
MIKELQDVVDLIAQCPEHVQRNAAQALSIELQQHEDWVSLGCPDKRKYVSIKLQRAADNIKKYPF